jgi:rod shape-determining protein MreD
VRRAITVRVVGPLQWIVYPALIAIAVTVLLAIPFRLFGLNLPEPVFPLVLAFAWPLIRPSMLAPLPPGPRSKRPGWPARSAWAAGSTP